MLRASIFLLAPLLSAALVAAFGIAALAACFGLALATLVFSTRGIADATDASGSGTQPAALVS